MASIRSKLKKAEPDQAFIKMGMYGGTGSGKTATALLIAEWLCAQENLKVKGSKYRVAMIDTEHHGGTSYALASPDRKMPDGKTPFHPEAFDFDILQTRSVQETLQLSAELFKDPGEYKVFVVDSFTHVWEAAMAGWPKRTTAGTISKNDWGKVKKPVKDIMENGLNAELHFIFCGREALQWEPDEKGEDKVVGYKMKTEGQIPYEPPTLVQMYQHRDPDRPGEWKIGMFFEKDRTGTLMGRTFINPPGNVIEPLFKLLVGKHGQLATEEETAAHDMKAAIDAEEKKDAEGEVQFRTIRKGIMEAESKEELKACWELTKGKKGVLGPRYDTLSRLVDARLVELNRSGNIIGKAANTESEPATAEEAN